MGACKQHVAHQVVYLKAELAQTNAVRISWKWVVSYFHSYIKASDGKIEGAPIFKSVMLQLNIYLGYIKTGL